MAYTDNLRSKTTSQSVVLGQRDNARMTNENLASVAELRIHPVKGLRGGVHMTADIEPWVWWETGAGWWWMPPPAS